MQTNTEAREVALDRSIDELIRVVGGVYIELHGKEPEDASLLALDIFHAALDADYVTRLFDGGWVVEDDFICGYVAAL